MESKGFFTMFAREASERIDYKFVGDILSLLATFWIKTRGTYTHKFLWTYLTLRHTLIQMTFNQKNWANIQNNKENADKKQISYM